MASRIVKGAEEYGEFNDEDDHLFPVSRIRELEPVAAVSALAAVDEMFEELLDHAIYPALALAKTRHELQKQARGLKKVGER